MPLAYKTSSGQLIRRNGSGQFRKTTLKDFGVSDSELASGAMVCLDCGYGSRADKWYPVMKTGYCPNCKSQNKAAQPANPADCATEPAKSENPSAQPLI